jgi:hypothetical protein
MARSTLVLSLLLASCSHLSEQDLTERMDLDGDGIARPVDCDDQDPSVGVAGTWFADGDGDGYGTSSTTTACDMPADYAEIDGDCDDGDAAVHPDAVELCNEQDDDCDGDVDEGQDLPTWYLDADQDGYGDDDSASQACTAPDGWIAQGEDCDDSDAAVNPGAEELCNGIDDDCDTVVDDGLEIPTWYADADHDGYGDPTAPQQACDMPSGHVAVAEDCDDADDEVHPDASETCNERDDDCDDEVDEGLEIPVWYLDADADGYGDPDFTLASCEQPSGYVASSSDCDDLDPGINPGESERCDADNLDEDCDGLADDADSGALGTVTVYQDIDGDGYGVDDSTAEACDASSGWALVAGDCDDADASRHPDTQWFHDDDEDGYGDPGDIVRACQDVDGYVLNDLDCDDTEHGYSPDAQEVCDLADIDEDCDGLVDDGDPSVLGQLTIYEDLDGDGYGDDATETLACDLWSGWEEASGDCDPADPDIAPLALEICDDGIDQDCDGDIDCDDPNCSTDEACGYFELSGADTRYFGAYGDHMGLDQISWVGDVTGDGGPDLVIGARYLDSGTGGAYIADGSLRGDVDLSVDAEAFLSGVATGDWAGWSVSGMADCDGDGFGEIAVGAKYQSDLVSNGGAAYLFRGPVTGTLSLADADVVVLGDTSSSLVGVGLNGRNDVTGDGVADLVVGASTYVGILSISGDTPAGTYLASEVDFDFGWQAEQICTGGDLNGDGHHDVVAHYSDTRLYYGPVYSGMTSASVNFGSGTGGFGESLTSGGDLNGDGYDDLVVGAPYDDTAATGAGAVYVFLPPFAASVDSSEAVSLITGEAGGDGAGASVELLEDLDGDGFADLLIGAPDNDLGLLNAGTTYLLYGPLSGTVSLADADIRMVGEQGTSMVGHSIAADADVDGDGRSDILIAAPMMDAPPYTGGADHGAVYLMLGSRF